MKKNEKILQLSEEILIDITNDRLPLHNILLKAAYLSQLLEMTKNVTIFKGWAKLSEQNSSVMQSFESNIAAAKDPNVSITSSNPQQYIHN